jgi:putative aldouronate transport system permease protein
VAQAKGSRKLFLFINTFLCILLAVLCIAPIVHIFAISLSGKDAIISGKVGFFPTDITLDNYAYVIKDNAFYTAFGISIVRTILALATQLIMIIFAAYPLSLRCKDFHTRDFFTWFFLIAILFSGGLIPTFLVVKNTGLLNSIWALIIPGAVPLFYVILMQNYMKSLPEEIRESAAMDGAGQFRTLVQIILPLCRVSIATISLFIIVDNWNAWYDGILYINDYHKFPLQTYLRTVIVKVDMNKISDLTSLAELVASGGADAAKIFLSLLPVLIIYPFAQKHFVKGIVLGSVKG